MVLTNTGRNLIRDSVKTIFTNAGVGLGTTAPSSSDTGLFGGGITVDTCDASTGWTNEGDASAVTLNTTAGEFKEGTGCLNLPLTYSTGTSGWYKTIGATDMDTDKHAFWFYITQVSELANSDNAVRLTLGTGGFTNASYYDTTRDSLSNGWNSIVHNLDTTSGTLGTGAVMTSIDRIKIEVLADSSQASNEMRMDYWRTYQPGTLGITDSQHALTLETGNYYFKTIHTIPTTESNGLSITESGDNNSTSLLSRQVFAALDKGNNTELQVDKYYYIESE